MIGTGSKPGSSGTMGVGMGGSRGPGTKDGIGEFVACSMNDERTPGQRAGPVH